VKRDSAIVATCLAAIGTVILSASLLCTWAIAHGASMRWRLAFRLFCHGIPERCIAIWGVPMPICARCTAIYAGLAVSLIVFLLLPRMSELAARVTLLIAVTPLAVDGLTQLARLRHSTNALRMATGLTAGIAFGLWAITAVESHVVTDS
jgi:uncharacterized membrane protein